MLFTLTRISTCPVKSNNNVVEVKNRRVKTLDYHLDLGDKGLGEGGVWRSLNLTSGRPNSEMSEFDK